MYVMIMMILIIKGVRVFEKLVSVEIKIFFKKIFGSVIIKIFK